MPDEDFDTDDDTQDDESGESQPRGNSDLRKLRTLAKEHPTLKTENRELKAELGLIKAGLGDLSDKRRAALIRELGDAEPTVDAIKEVAVEFGWAEAPGADELEGEGRVAAAATGSNESSGVLKPEHMADWHPDRIIAFKQANPEKFEALKRGETVTI